MAGESLPTAADCCSKQVEDRFRFIERFAGCFTDDRDPDLLEHSLVDLLKQRIFGLCLGYEDLLDHDTFRHDALLAVLVGKDDPLHGHQLGRFFHGYYDAYCLPAAVRVLRRSSAAGAVASSMTPSPALHLKLAEMERIHADADGQKRHQSAAAELRGVAAYRDNNLDAAAAELQQAVELRPENMRAWYYLGEVLRVRGQLAAARAAYERCVELDSHHHRALKRLTDGALSAGS